MALNLIKMAYFKEIKHVSLIDPAYPLLLKNIYDPPALLYYRGTLIMQKFTLAIVGSRRMSSYGKRALEQIFEEMAGQDLTIVSGLAYGIDAYAHQLAIKHRLRTIAVLGSGPDDNSIYPRKHSSLAKEIIQKGGAVMSEFPPGTPGLQYHFPMRNRIISGLSHAVLVIEASEKSGSLITAQFALEQGRSVYALPGSIFCANSKGTNNLIKQGAGLLTNFNDLLLNL